MARTERSVDVGEVRLQVVEEGEGEPVVLLHGFPEYWYSWRHQLPALAGAGYRAVAPDLRGYGGSDKPRGTDAYTLPRLEADVAGLLRSLGVARAHIVGHDWGGLLAWAFAARHPELTRSLTILNAPHPRIIARHLLTNPAQLLRSYYVFFFQLPFLPEAATRRPGLVARAMRGMAVHKHRFPREELAHFEAAYQRPGVATAALNYYRAAVRNPRQTLAGLDRVAAPTLVIWGEQDTALGTELLVGLEQYAPDLRVHRIPDASHWVQQDAPEAVNAALLGFLRGR